MSQTPGAFSLETWWEKLIERTPVKYISLVLGAIGIWLVWEFPPGYFRYSIGEAAVIAALLMLLVDPFLKARLLKEAARDIFEYLLGFDQQPQLKERLKRSVFDTKLFRGPGQAVEADRGSCRDSACIQGISYRFDGKCAVSCPLSFYCAHFGYPTIGVTVKIEHPQTLEVDAAPTPSHEGNVWRYERLFMPGDHINIRWRQTK